MKVKILSYITFALAIALSSCTYDNFEEPQSTITGRVVYQNQQIGVRSNGVQLELWQPGYAVFEKIPVYVNQDGSFNAVVFDGDYKLTRLRGNGPWVENTDTINVQVRGTTMVDVPVTPYYVINSATYQKNANALTTTVNVAQVAAGRAIERVTYYIGTTTIVDNTNFAAVTDIWWPDEATASAPMSMSLELANNLAGRDYVFARVGVKVDGVPEMLFTQVEKVQL